MVTEASEARSTGGYRDVMRFRRRREREERGFQYSRWDGTQVGFDLDADALLDEMTDDLLYHGDLHAALRRMMQQGMQDRNGEQLMGLREMLQRLREQRREKLDRYDLGGVYEEIAEQLARSSSRSARASSAGSTTRNASGDKRRQEIVDDLAEQRREQLDQLPPDLAGKVQRAPAVRLDGRRRAPAVRGAHGGAEEAAPPSYVQPDVRGHAEHGPGALARMKDMLAELNQMLEQRERGEEPDFEGFMERYGDFFPGNPQTLDELLEQMAQSMAQMQQLMNSMTPEQRAQLQELADSLLDDMDLRWQVDQLGPNLQQAFPQLPWERSMRFRGDDPLSMGQVPGLLDPLGDIDDLEHLLRQATQPGELAEVDLDRARELLGDDAARSLERLAELARMLEEAGLIEQREGRLELTPRASAPSATRRSATCSASS